MRNWYSVQERSSPRRSIMNRRNIQRGAPRGKQRDYAAFAPALWLQPETLLRKLRASQALNRRSCTCASVDVHIRAGNAVRAIASVVYALGALERPPGNNEKCQRTQKKIDCNRR